MTSATAAVGATPATAATVNDKWRVGEQQWHPQLQLEMQTRARECKQRQGGGLNANRGGGVWGVWMGTRGYEQA